MFLALHSYSSVLTVPLTCSQHPIALKFTSTQELSFGQANLQGKKSVRGNAPKGIPQPMIQEEQVDKNLSSLCPLSRYLGGMVTLFIGFFPFLGFFSIFLLPKMSFHINCLCTPPNLGVCFWGQSNPSHLPSEN